MESSLIQPSERMLKAKGGEIQKEMASNLLNDISDCTVHRISWNFNIENSSIDTMIGRTAHIQFLDNHELIRMLIYILNDIFTRHKD